jgi:hypothetical protein
MLLTYIKHLKRGTTYRVVYEVVADSEFTDGAMAQLWFDVAENTVIASNVFLPKEFGVHATALVQVSSTEKVSVGTEMWGYVGAENPQIFLRPKTEFTPDRFEVLEKYKA